MNPLRVVSYYNSTIYRVDEEKLKEYNHEAVIFAVSVIIALAGGFGKIPDSNKPYFSLFIIFLTALYFILWFIRKVRLESNKKYQIEVGRKEKAVAVVFTFLTTAWKAFSLQSPVKRLPILML